MSTYLDHNASTPLDPRVLDVMQPFLSGPYANPSSPHRQGRAARDAVETARTQVAAMVGARPGNLIFTSGGTEANNLAVKGIAARGEGRLLYSAIEHPCVQEPMDALRRVGRKVEQVAVDADGRINLTAFGRQLSGSPVRLVSCMVANNETGVLQDIAGLAAASHKAGAVFHADAVQAAGKIAVDFPASGADAMSLSSHKIYGPKGAGALLVNDDLDFEPLLHGGGQERGHRGGTENVAAIAGFGAAAEFVMAEMEARAAHTRRLRDRLEAALFRQFGLRPFGAAAPRLPNTCQFAIAGVHSATLLGLLDRQGFAVSSGSACASGTDQPSPVLLAMGVPAELAWCAIRVSLGKDNTADQVDCFVAALDDILRGIGVRPAAVRSA